MIAEDGGPRPAGESVEQIPTLIGRLQCLAARGDSNRLSHVSEHQRAFAEWLDLTPEQRLADLDGWLAIDGSDLTT